MIKTKKSAWIWWEKRQEKEGGENSLRKGGVLGKLGEGRGWKPWEVVGSSWEIGMWENTVRSK